MDRAQKQHMLEELKLEREFVRRGGYHASVRDPRREPTHLRDSVTCLNVNKSEDLEPCDRCFWYDLVPEERRDREMPCRHIPLDAQGNTYVGRKALRDALFATKNFKGLTGTLACNQFGDCADPHLAVYQITSGDPAKWDPGATNPKVVWPPIKK